MKPGQILQLMFAAAMIYFSYLQLNDPALNIIAVHPLSVSLQTNPAVAIGGDRPHA